MDPEEEPAGPPATFAYRRALRTLLDLVLFSAAFGLAFLIRFEGDIPLEMVSRMLFSWPYVLMVGYLSLAGLGVTQFAWRYTGFREFWRILWACAAATAVMALVRFLGVRWFDPQGLILNVTIPYGVIALFFLLSCVLFFVSRGLVRLRVERDAQHRARESGRTVERVPALLIGAGEAGLLVAKELVRQPDSGLEAVGFVDDDAQKQGLRIHGLPVLGTTHDIPKAVRATGAREGVICITYLPRETLRRLYSECQEAGLTVRIIPNPREILSGEVPIARLRKVEMEDLLGREAVDLDVEAIGQIVRGRVVMVTGAGGSIGAELCRQVCRFQPQRLLLVERFENGLFEIHREMAARFPSVEVEPCLADVGDAARMAQLFEAWSPAVIFHAAAHKHVPMMEWNPGEAAKNNVFGTRCLADLAHAHKCQAFVMISTDKAVNPSSIMGLSKRVAEIYVQALARQSSTRFVTVRFGNVLGSSGSVIPIFREQIARGGPVTVTHPEMTRYFMTITEACQLVLQAAAMGAGGEIFVLDMGAPVRIVDLARDLIRLAGMVPEKDIQIQYTGVRPGEKLFEQIALDDEHAQKTRHPKIFIGKLRSFPLDEVRAVLEGVRPHLHSRELGPLIEQIRKIVPEFRNAPEHTD